MKKVALHAFVAGAFSALLLHLTAEIAVSALAVNWGMDGCLHAFTLAAAISFALSLFLVRGLTARLCLRFLLLDTLSFVLCFLLGIALLITSPVALFPPRETNTADGLVLLIGGALFVFLSLAARLCLLGLKSKKNRVHNS